MADRETYGPNDRLRRARESHVSPSGSGRPMSRRELADAASAHLRHPLSDDYIARLERGEIRWPSKAIRDGLRRLLGASEDSELGFYITRPARTLPPVFPAGVTGDPPDVSAVTGATDRDESSQTVVAVQGLTAIRERLTHAMLGRAAVGAGPPLGAAELRAAAQRAWSLRQAALYHELASLLSEVVPAADSSVRKLEGLEARDAGAASVHLYNAASSLLKRLGDTPLGTVAADRACRVAEELGDSMLLAAAQFRLANVLLAGGRLTEAHDIALSSADRVDPGKTPSPEGMSTWGALLLTAAVASAKAADRSRAWELIGEARTAGRILGLDHADMYAVFGPTNVAINGIQVAVELGDGGDAVRRSRHVNSRNLPHSLVERRGQYLIDLSRAYLLTKDAEGASATLLEAERFAPQEVRLSSDAHTVVRALLGHPGVGRTSEVWALAGRIGVEG